MGAISRAKDDDLDLPPLDGEGDEETGDDAAEELDEETPDGADAFDDATAEDEPIELAVEGAEAGWLQDADDAESLDVGVFELVSDADSRSGEDDEPDTRMHDDDLLGIDDSVAAVDSGEEGPLADDEELKEEDLPALDADEDGDVADDVLFDRAMLGAEEELRWDDRAWARVAEFDGGEEDGRESHWESGTLVAPGEEKQSARDAAWRHLDESGRVTAAAFVPGDSVVVALDERTRTMLVRIRPDGTSRIIAEIDAPSGDDDGEPLRVTALRWDGSSGWLIARGTFGVQAFRPA
ncbi:hypothetical protein AKJ09_09493 [Labilithrix luteola]|uniref:Uncharacterized protein n=1 Tax=Labilithrix luteola TaxID=1391654 RepID=A0A0K1QBP5_9BACT|nr:hypothetical protein [Labilithrix luteola]AKV02830.1 hypothetical protein AKJ09_09493 [Labilithrix luteola]